MSWWGIVSASFLQLPAAWEERKLDIRECLKLLNTAFVLEPPGSAGALSGYDPKALSMSASLCMTIHCTCHVHDAAAAGAAPGPAVVL